MITQAKEFLTDSQLSITEIAHAMGFNDNPLYFSDFFKSAVGMYPSNYRKLHAKKSDIDKNSNSKDK